MTESQRKSILERIEILKTRNKNLYAITHVSELSEFAIDEIRSIISENNESIRKLTDAKNKKYEFIFNFKSDGLNSECAYTVEEAKEQAKKRYGDGIVTGPDWNSFRVNNNSYLPIFSLDV